MIGPEVSRVFGLGVPELIFIMLLALLIFGPKRLPEIGRTLGRGMSEFRKASNDLKRTINVELALDEPPPPPVQPYRSNPQLDALRAPRQPHAQAAQTTQAAQTAQTAAPPATTATALPPDDRPDDLPDGPT